MRWSDVFVLHLNIFFWLLLLSFVYLYCPLHDKAIKHNKCILLLYFLRGFHLCLPLSNRGWTGSTVTFITMLVCAWVCVRTVPFSLSEQVRHTVLEQQKDKGCNGCWNAGTLLGFLLSNHGGVFCICLCVCKDTEVSVCGKASYLALCYKAVIQKSQSRKTSSANV